MQKTLHIIYLLVFTFTIKSLSAQEMFQKTISIVNGGYSVGETIVENDDGTFFISGYAQTAIAPQSNFDFFLVKMDSTGNILWGKTYGGANAELLGTMEKLSDGNLLIAGVTVSYVDTVDGSAYIIKVDTSGNLLWSKIYDGNFADGISDISQNGNGDILFVGATNGLPFVDSTNALAICMDINGNTKWTKKYDLGYNESFYEIVATEDYGYNIVGHISSNSIILYDVFVIKIDSSGNQVWGKVYGSPDSVSLISSGIHLLVDHNDNVLISAFTSDYGTLIGRDFLLLKHDANGNLLWANRYGGLWPGDHEVHDMIEAIDGKYYVDWGNNLNLIQSTDGSVITTKDYSMIPGIPRSLITKSDKGMASIGLSTNGLVTYFNIDSLGNQCFNSNLNMPYASVLVGNSNLNFQISNITLSENTGCTVASITPNDSTYCFTATSIDDLSFDRKKIRVFPNPVDEQLFIDLSELARTEEFYIRIFDITGKQIFENTIKANVKSTQLNVSGFTRGLYILSVTNSTEKYVIKFSKF